MKAQRKVARPVFSLRSGPKALILDYDGTLVDTISLWVSAVDSVFRKHGLRSVTKNDMSKHGLNALLRKLTGSTQGNPIPSAQYIQEIWSNFAERLDAHWYLMGGVKETLRKLKDSGIRLVLVSKRAGKAAQQTREELKRYDLEEYFEEIYTGVSLDDYRGLLKEISQRLSRNPESIAVVSDWALDLRTARELGLKTIGVLSGVSTSSELKRGGADKIMKSVNELTVR